MKKQAANIIIKNNTAYGILNNAHHRIVFTAAANFVFNFCYALYNGILGIIYGSLWFTVLCAYYAVLAVMRFAAVSGGLRYILKKQTASEVFVIRFIGIMLMILSIVLSVSVYYGCFRETAKRNGTIVMITIAAYTFYKVIIAFVNAVKTSKQLSPLLSAIRGITCADAAASVLSLQRSMLASFDGKSPSEIRLMNTITGVLVCIFIFSLGLIMTVGILGGENGKIKNCKSKQKNCRQSNKLF